MMRASTAVFASLALVATSAAGCKKKAPEPTGPILGWHAEEGAVGACWYPPDFDTFGASDRRMERNTAVEAMMSQWKGERDDGVSFDARYIENIETILLGYPDKVEDVVRQNLAQCKKAMRGGGTGAWETWIETLPAKLTKGECMRPLDDTMFWYADIGMGWQGGADICDDDTVRIWASAQDYYKVDDDSEWINAEGDLSKSTAGADGYLCNTEGCYAGQLVMRFRGNSGAELVMPVGLELIFSPPEHGTIEFAVNDTSYFNNKWKVERGVQHRTSVTYEPVED